MCPIQWFLVFGHKVRYPHLYPRRLISGPEKMTDDYLLLKGVGVNVWVRCIRC